MNFIVIIYKHFHRAGHHGCDHVDSNVAVCSHSNPLCHISNYASLHLSYGLMGSVTVVNRNIAGDMKPHIDFH
jgi:hypothetical protein